MRPRPDTPVRAARRAIATSMRLLIRLPNNLGGSFKPRSHNRWYLRVDINAMKRVEDMAIAHKAYRQGTLG